MAGRSDAENHVTIVDLDPVADDLIIDLREPATAPDLHPVTSPDVVEVPAGAYRTFVKPTLDRVAAAFLLLLLLPVLLTVAAGVRWSLGRGVFYRQTRIGLGGTPFTVLKFRTMLPDRRAARTTWDHADRRMCHKSSNDPRHTRVGSFLRKWSLDELPQLVNVLRGEMSLVGPRPELPHIVDRYEPWEHARHAVRPGLTGFWQTTARSDGPMQEFTHLDIEYVRSVSFTTDLRLLVATPFAALGAQKGS
jgi:lipopolysaccharide/colanic/teichoic acid biosynthesis glycosyltransferase